MDTDVLESASNISPNTIKLYVAIANKFNDENEDDLELDQIKEVVKLIKSITMSANVQGNYFSAIMKQLELEDRLQLKEKYRTILRTSIKKSDKSKKVLKKIVQDADYKKGKRKLVKRLVNKEYENLSIQEFIISFYLLQPPRRADYFDMVYTEIRENTKDETKNWLFIKGRSIALYFNKFKNVHRIGKQKFFVSNPNLRKVIRKRGLTEGERLYPKSRNIYTNDIGKITTELFGQRLLINDLRVLHSTTLFGNNQNTTVKKLQDDSDRMGHSIPTKISQYIRE